MDDKASINGKISTYLGRVTKQLAMFLEKTLPTLFDDWWKKAVLNALSYQQMQRLEERQITTLAGLDLASLLRVMDQNWYAISNHLNLSRETRNFLKEMQSVRNRWAHQDTMDVSADDIYQDLDTIRRFAHVIGAEGKLIQEIQDTRDTLIHSPAHQQISANATPKNELNPPSPNMAEFKMAQMVFTPANPSCRGQSSQWHDFMEAKIAPSTMRYYEFLINNHHLLPNLGNMPVKKIKPSHLIEAFRKIEEKRTPYSAKRSCQVCSQIMQYATALEIIEINPVQSMRPLLRPPKCGHFAAITDPEVLGKLLNKIDIFLAVPH